MLEEIFKLKCLSVCQVPVNLKMDKAVTEINHLKCVVFFKNRIIGCSDKRAVPANTLPISRYVQCPIIATYSCDTEHPSKEDELLQSICFQVSVQITNLFWGEILASPALWDDHRV